MPNHDIRHREILAEGSILILQHCAGGWNVVYTVAPYIGSAPDYHYEGKSYDEALEVFGDILEADVMEAM